MILLYVREYICHITVIRVYCAIGRNDVFTKVIEAAPMAGQLKSVSQRRGCLDRIDFSRASSSRYRAIHAQLNSRMPAFLLAPLLKRREGDSWHTKSLNAGGAHQRSRLTFAFTLPRSLASEPPPLRSCGKTPRRFARRACQRL